MTNTFEKPLNGTLMDDTPPEGVVPYYYEEGGLMAHALEKLLKGIPMDDVRTKEEARVDAIEYLMYELDALRIRANKIKLDLHQDLGYTKTGVMLDSIESLLKKADELYELHSHSYSF